MSFRYSHPALLRFSPTVRLGKMPLPPGTWAMPRRATWPGLDPTMSSPSKTTLPADGGASPEMALSSVDLPAPLVPRRARISPRATSRLTPKSTWVWS